MAIAAVVAMVVVSMGIGAGFERRRPERAPRAAKGTLNVLLFGLFPVITFFNVARLEIDAALLGGLGLSLLALALAGVVAYVGARLLGLSRPATGSVICATVQPNTGYLGLPVAAAILGGGALGAAIAFDTVISLVMLYLVAFGVGAAFGTDAGDTPRERATAFVTRNPPLVALVLGLLAPDALAPDVLVDVSRVLVFAVAPLGFFAAGVTLASETRAGGRLELDRAVGLAVTTRLVVAPALLLALAAPLIVLPDAYLLQAAMPAGINGLVVAHAYGLDLRVSASAITLSTAVVLAVAVVSEVW